MFFDVKVKVLSEQIKHHVHEEEKPSEGMVASAEKHMLIWVDLRDKMLARKKELLAQAKGAGCPGRSRPRSICSLPEG